MTWQTLGYFIGLSVFFLVDWGDLKEKIRLRLLVRRWEKEFVKQSEKSFDEFFSEKYHTLLDKTYLESVEELQKVAKLNATTYRKNKEELNRIFGKAED